MASTPNRIQTLQKRIDNMFRQISDEKERKQRGFQVARMCLNEDRADIAEKYINDFLSIHKTAPAYKLHGEICEKLRDNKSAYNSYKKAFESDADDSNNVLEKICRLGKHLEVDDEEIRNFETKLKDIEKKKFKIRTPRVTAQPPTSSLYSNSPLRTNTSYSRYNIENNGISPTSQPSNNNISPINSTINGNASIAVDNIITQLLEQNKCLFEGQKEVYDSAIKELRESHSKLERAIQNIETTTRNLNDFGEIAEKIKNLHIQKEEPKNVDCAPKYNSSQAYDIPNVNVQHQIPTAQNALLQALLQQQFPQQNIIRQPFPSPMVPQQFDYQPWIQPPQSSNMYKYSSVPVSITTGQQYETNQVNSAVNTLSALSDTNIPHSSIYTCPQRFPSTKPPTYSNDTIFAKSPDSAVTTSSIFKPVCSTSKSPGNEKDSKDNKQFSFLANTNTKQFAGFGSTTVKTNIFESNEKSGVVSPPQKDDTEEFEPNVDFKPICQLPTNVVTITGEESENISFCHRGKLFRYDSNQWKERGIGDIKILKSKDTGKHRIIFRREQVLKLACNHFINSEMKLNKLGDNDNALCWYAQDFADEELKKEQFAIRFKEKDILLKFKQKFEEAVEEESSKTKFSVNENTQVNNDKKQDVCSLKSDFNTLFKKKMDDWECPSCLVRNKKEDDTCICCNGKPSKDATQDKPVETKFNFKAGFLKGSAVDLPVAETDFKFGQPVNTTNEKVLFNFGKTQENSSIFSFNPKNVSSPNSIIAKNYEQNESGLNETDNLEEHESSAHFEPIIQLDTVELVTGEEDENVLFMSRAKLFRYTLNEWKERGIGFVKILQNKKNLKCRILMRRDNIHKICLNHWLSAEISLEPMGKGNAWIWYADDFADEEVKMQQFAMKFKNEEIANKFRESFDKAKNSDGKLLDFKVILDSSRRDSTDAINKDSSKLKTSNEKPLNLTSSATKQSCGFNFSPQSGTVSQLSFNFKMKYDQQDSIHKENEIEVLNDCLPSTDKIELAKKFQLSQYFYNYESKSDCEGCIGCNPDEFDFNRIGKEPDKPKKNLFGVFGSNSETSKIFGGSSGVSFSDVISNTDSNWTKRENFQFIGTGKPLFQQNNNDEKNENNNEMVESHDIHFEPIIKLDEIEVKTGEEDEEVLFNERSKLYRFTDNQWKERGIGQMKILKSKNGLFRIVFRREQILKVACNHRITEELNLSVLKTSENAWCWTAKDFSESNEGVVEQFAVRFKSKDNFSNFSRIFNECKEKTKNTSEFETEDESEVAFTRNIDLSIDNENEINNATLIVCLEKATCYRIFLKDGSSNIILGDHLICQEHLVHKNNNINAEWNAVYNSKERHFKIKFKSADDLNEFVNLFNEGVDIAKDNKISEKK